MSCELYDDVLDEYVDGARAADNADAASARLAAFESHLAGCARCQALVTDFATIRRTAETLDDHVPPPRVWARIASSIEQEARKPWWARLLANRPAVPVSLAAAASLALLLGGAAWLDWPQGRSSTTQTGALQTPEAGTAMAEQHYEEAIAGLQQIVDAQDADLDPDTRAVLRQNLAVIDRAISESRDALSDEPASTLAQESLLDALDTKVALLQDTVALASEIDSDRPDDAAGAAQVNQ
jgi:hypothetical protein